MPLSGPLDKHSSAHYNRETYNWEEPATSRLRWLSDIMNHRNPLLTLTHTMKPPKGKSTGKKTGSAATAVERERITPTDFLQWRAEACFTCNLLYMHQKKRTTLFLVHFFNQHETYQINSNLCNNNCYKPCTEFCPRKWFYTVYYTVSLQQCWLMRCFNTSLQIISLQNLLLTHKIRLQIASSWQATGSTLPMGPALALGWCHSNKPDAGSQRHPTLCTTSHPTCVPMDFTQLLSSSTGSHTHTQAYHRASKLGQKPTPMPIIPPQAQNTG